MYPPEVEYIKNQLADHLALFFISDACELFKSELIRFVTYEEAISTDKKSIAIPYDIPIEPTTIEG